MLMLGACQSTTPSTADQSHAAKATDASADVTQSPAGGQARVDAGTGSMADANAVDRQHQPTAADSGMTDAVADSGTDSAARDAGMLDSAVPDTAMPEAGASDSATPDSSSALSKPDASAPTPDAGNDASLPVGQGSCCTAHDTPGCSNAELQVCVCEKLPECCTKQWTAACTLIVEQKYCQPGVRDCVCGSGSGQWGQKSCCESDWSASFCNQVAESKCGAQRGCM